MKNWFVKKFWTNFSTFEKFFLTSMIMMQILIFCITPDNPLNLVAGVTAIVSSVLCSKGQISFYFFSLIQTISYMALAWQGRFYGMVIENIFYLITTLWCVLVWEKNSRLDENGTKIVKVKKATPKMLIISIVGMVVATIALGFVLGKVGSAQTYTDAAMTIMSVYAQFLMVYGYREQWLLWIVVDLLSVKMWFVAGNPSMVAMCLAWTANCIYGWRNWNRLNIAQNTKRVV